MELRNKIVLQGGIEPYEPPPPPELCWCYFTLTDTIGGFVGWTINGVDFLTNYASTYNALGLSYSKISNYIDPLLPNEIAIWYNGDCSKPPVLPLVKTEDGAIVTPRVATQCEKTCWECSFQKPHLFITRMNPFGTGYTTSLDIPASFGQPSLNLSNVADQNLLKIHYQSMYGAGCNITFTSIGGNVVVKITGSYIDSLTIPYWETPGFLVSFTQTPC